MSKPCGKLSLSPSAFKHLHDIGVDIHAGRQPLVFDGGLVGRNFDQKGEVQDAPQPHSRNGSKTGSREGQRTPSRHRSPRQAEPIGSNAHEEAYGAGFHILAQHYDALSVEDNAGLWVAVKSHPLGSGGPQAHFLVAMPLDQSMMPRAWAFSSIGNEARPFPLKHTNFPDASVCAFTDESNAWGYEDGILALIDHYSLWAAKSLHRTIVGWWPGPQIGVCAKYRRHEFVGPELCGCESGKRYSECHQGSDLLINEETASLEFKRLFGTPYEDRALPHAIIEAAKCRWRRLPNMQQVLLLRQR